MRYPRVAIAVEAEALLIGPEPGSIWRRPGPNETMSRPFLLGGIIGGWLFARFGFLSGNGILGSIVTAFVGAVILLVVVRLAKRA